MIFYMNNITTNGFSLEILVGGLMPAKIRFINGAYYIIMKHKQEYKIMLSNNNSTRADADVWIDNQNIGSWRLNPYSSITIERPVEFNRKFIFLQEGTTIADRSGIVNHSNDNGLIKVLFKPELEPRLDYYSYTNSMSESQTRTTSSYSHGATALGNQSNQQYTNATPIYNYEKNKFATITARMIIDNNNDNAPISIRKAFQYPKRLDYGMFDDNYDPAYFIERFTQ